MFGYPPDNRNASNEASSSITGLFNHVRVTTVCIRLTNRAPARSPPNKLRVSDLVSTRNNQSSTSSPYSHFDWLTLRPQTNLGPASESLSKTSHISQLGITSQPHNLGPPLTSTVCVLVTLIMALCFKARKTSPKSEEEGTEDISAVYSVEKGQEKMLRPGEWIRPLGEMETLMAFGGMFTSLNTVQAIWLSSEEVIKKDDVAEALKHLTRRIPLLQLCLARRGCRFWFKRMKKLVLDFEETAEDIMSVYQKQLSSFFDLWHGPLWSVRLVTLPEQDKEPSPHQAVLIFTVQHTITDGTTNMVLCKETVATLNALLKGRNLPTTIYPIDPPVMDSLANAKSVPFLAKYFVKKFAETFLMDFSYRTSFKGALPRPRTKVSETRVIKYDFDEETTKRLLSVCKAKHVTVHSCIVAAANFAFYKVAMDSALKNASSTINLTNCVNMRRYYSQEYKNSLGCHISLEEIEVTISPADFSRFWSHACKIHNILREHLEVQKLPVKIIPIIKFASIIYPVNTILTKHGLKNRTDCHYITTNMGNLKHLLSEDDNNNNNPVQIASLLRSVSSEHGGNTCMLTFHTFRGRFMLSLDYYSTKMADDVAVAFLNTVSNYISDVAKLGDIKEQT